MNKIRILPIGGTRFNVFLDDIEISKYVSGVRIKMNAGKFPEISLDVVGAVEIPENILALLKSNEGEAESDPE